MKPKPDRPRLAYRPIWTKELAGYSYNAMRKYWPALRPWFELDDILQEAQVVFLICQKRYTGVVDNPAWFMALFKTAWHNRLIGMIAKASKYSVLEGMDYDPRQEASSDKLADLVRVIEKLPLDLSLTLSELCRAKGRFKVSRRSVSRLKSALAAAT